jgi:hypothetical protein
VKLVDISGKKTKVYLKATIDEIGTNSTIKNNRDFDRGINDFKRD